ncbi:HTH_48 domain-containing protein [Trichonephila clavipes]|nr:HTH_48 domain-containing protein [Trichonephila clavipes]
MNSSTANCIENLLGGHEHTTKPFILIEYKRNLSFELSLNICFLKDNTPTQIKDKLDSVYGDSAPSFTTVKFWAAKFKGGRKPITGAYHASLLGKLKRELAEKRPHLQKRKSFFTKTTHGLTPQRLPWRKSTNYGLNCLTIRLTQQI